MSDGTGEFVLDTQLVADTLPIGDLDFCRVLLMNDARFPWLILVPRRAGLRELIDLPVADQQHLLAEVNRCAHALHALFKPHKLNIAMLGNMVAQLHVHVIARFRDDAAWPRPVWGVDPVQSYTVDDADKRLAELRTALQLHGG